MNRIDPTLAYALEESEVAYWSKYYQVQAPMKSYANIIAGAFAGAVPEQDILSMNRVIGLGMRQSVKSEYIDDIIRFYTLAGTKRFFIQLSPYVIQDDLRDLLHDKGFRHHNNWAKLWRKADLTIPNIDTELEAVRIGPNDALAYGQIIFDSFD